MGGTLLAYKSVSTREERQYNKDTYNSEIWEDMKGIINKKYNYGVKYYF